VKRRMRVGDVGRKFIGQIIVTAIDQIEATAGRPNRDRSPEHREGAQHTDEKPARPIAKPCIPRTCRLRSFDWGGQGLQPEYSGRLLVESSIKVENRLLAGPWDLEISKSHWLLVRRAGRGHTGCAAWFGYMCA